MTDTLYLEATPGEKQKVLYYCSVHAQILNFSFSRLFSEIVCIFSVFIVCSTCVCVCGGGGGGGGGVSEILPINILWNITC